MRKIDKTNQIATAFQNSVKPNQYEGGTFSNRYHKDVLASLLYCQEGLCAYTEKRLLHKSQEEMSNLFVNGEYQLKDEKGNKIKPDEVFADIEHYRGHLKKTNGWDWDNLFAVYDPVNRNIKRVEEPKFEKKCQEKGWDFDSLMLMLKPDNIDYEVDRFLEYDIETHKFTARLDLDDVLAEQIEHILMVLGINCAPIKNERIDKIETWLNKIKQGEKPTISEFPTAFEFCRRAGQMS
jgi:hypothetical protein